MYHTDNLSESESDRPGIVHRIDKDTSGLLLISKTNLAHNILSLDFQNKNIKRKYFKTIWKHRQLKKRNNNKISY